MKKYLLSVMKGQQRDIKAFLIVFLLWPFTFIYALGLFCHRAYFQFTGAYKAPKPVISIGNITVGGSGKTPLVIWLAKSLQNKGFKSIILIRGYMPKANKVSDEVDMLNEQIPYIPVLAGSNRAANIREAESILPVDVYICDDAFQHWPLQRDLNVVAIDALNPFGNGHLLPAGILREPLSALKRAHVFILTKTDVSTRVPALIAKLQRINPQALILESRYKSASTVGVFDMAPMPDDFLKNNRVAAFCAIGEPLSFEASLKNSGALIAKLFVYMDHHVYAKSDIQHMLDFCRAQDIHVLVTTHKDAVKLRSLKDLFNGVKVVYMPIQIEITKGADEFFAKIDSIRFN